MKILKLTIVGLIISQSVFAGYGKAIVGGAVGGAVAGVVTNAMSKNSTHSESSKSSHGSLVMDCCCPHGLHIDRTSGGTVVQCYTDKNKTVLKPLLYGGYSDITVIPHTCYENRGYCEVSK